MSKRWFASRYVLEVRLVTPKEHHDGPHGELFDSAADAWEWQVERTGSERDKAQKAFERAVATHRRAKDKRAAAQTDTAEGRADPSREDVKP